MSCGDPHDNDCSEVLERVFFFIDNELPDGRQVRDRSSTSTSAAPACRSTTSSAP